MNKETKKEHTHLMDKIKKLLRLADTGRGATPAEAASAAAKAQALLLEHNLSMSDLGDLEAHFKDEKIEKETVDLDATYQTSRWHMTLVYRVAKPLMCRSIYTNAKAGKAGKVTILGKPSNIEVVKYFYTYLYREIDKMALEFREKWKAEMAEKGLTYIPDESSRVRIDFCFGAVAVIGDRMTKMYEDTIKASATSTALVVVNDQALDTAYKLAFPNTTKTKSNRMVNGSARAAGALAGASIPLNKGMSGSARKRVA